LSGVLSLDRQFSVQEEEQDDIIFVISVMETITVVGRFYKTL